MMGLQEFWVLGRFGRRLLALVAAGSPGVPFCHFLGSRFRV